MQKKVIHWTQIEGTDRWEVWLDGDRLTVLNCAAGAAGIREMLLSILGPAFEGDLAPEED